ncbi:LysM peptidoglycan-binding domain-containing protein [Nocardioides sp. TRM66260-LWL]|uniref:LysM peptidoglycan-binding domain-containing protein n=1 Tax=Nocardioides sp. TRM66260-LWL TaxID=2874478 RepID=UPI001CC44BF2|nr:LysM peptidoglycan-binding domain-containing protein [Nocardioides sp. TRM66260-LWL]MBZ5735362.1 LysM peptidoglycan-binding domain-containing protein [Nocardioides sp. TRM66260-LWL]
MMVRLLTRLGALLVLLGILVGFPALLIAAVGNPWPAGGIDELSLMSNSAVLGLLSVLGWFVWAQLVLCTLWEIPPALRHETSGASRMPIALGGQQRFMRLLVHTVLAVGVTSTLLSSHVARAEAAPAVPLAPVAHVAVQAAAPATTPTAASATPVVEHTQHTQQGDPTIVTERGDTLWALAEAHLGDGFRWQEIADLNHGRVMPDGRIFSNPRTLEPGWELRVPADATNLPGAGAPGAQTDHVAEHVVEPGDTLSAISQETTGDAESWPELYDANRTVIGADPDLILPGQVLVLPGVSPANRHEQTEGRHSGETGPDSSEVHGPATGDQQTAPKGTDQAPDQAPEQVPGQVPSTPAAPVEPTAPAAPLGADTTTGEATPPDQVQAPEHDDGITALRALLASAVCLSVGALGLVAANRRRQFRRRRIGRTIASTPDELAAVEQAIVEHGTDAQDDVEFLDRALRHVAACCHAAGNPLPQLGAAVLGGEDLTLLFTHPAVGEVPEGWSATDDARAWMLPRWTFLEADLETQPAPYPALVTIGQDEGGRTWLLDLETLGTFGIGGEPQQVADLARFLVAELAVNAWSEGSEVMLADQFGSETIGLNPTRLRQVDRHVALARAAGLVGEIDEVEQNLDADVLTRRRDGLVLDTTHPVVVVVPSRPEGDLVDDLTMRQRSRIVVVHGEEEAPAVELTGDGMAFLPMWGISVRAFTLPASEAEAMAALLTSTRNLEDQPMPAPESDDGPLGKYALADGSLREEYTEPRHTDGNDPSSLLPDADAVYLATAATTVEDLAVAAPSIPAATLEEIEAIDPTLAEDLADWFDETSPRPKIRLLGPVDVQVRGGGDPTGLSNLAGTISFIAYLACQDRGVTGERAADAFGWKTTKTVQNRATDARYLLGTRPDGSDWLPEAGASDGARRGAPTYGLVTGTGGVLVDFDLFRRLHFRARKLGDVGGEQDLVTALSLVAGAPFEASTDRRFPWLFKGQRHDDIMSSAIQKVAHVLATRAVAEGRMDLVRLACEAARKANPYTDVAWLDLAAAAEAESGRAAADALVRTNVVDRFDEDLPPRTEAVLDQRDWAAG